MSTVWGAERRRLERSHKGRTRRLVSICGTKEERIMKVDHPVRFRFPADGVEQWKAMKSNE